VNAFDRVEITVMSQDEAVEIAAWRYEPPYDFYDADADDRDLSELLDPARRGERYFAVREADGTLIGFLQLDPVDDAVDVGLGLRPDLTGRGLGQQLVESCLAFGRDRYSPRRFTLSVAAFNTRAIAVYERAGFVRTRSYQHETNGGVFSFIQMERSA
jgi:ribosomal-protein-alanine N-acetyltransferase